MRLDRPLEGRPSPAEFNALRAALGRRGCTTADLNRALGTTVGKSRREIAAGIIEMCRSFPKATP